MRMIFNLYTTAIEGTSYKNDSCTHLFYYICINIYYAYLIKNLLKYFEIEIRKRMIYKFILTYMLSSHSLIGGTSSYY